MCWLSWPGLLPATLPQLQDKRQGFQCSIGLVGTLLPVAFDFGTKSLDYENMAGFGLGLDVRYGKFGIGVSGGYGIDEDGYYNNKFYSYSLNGYWFGDWATLHVTLHQAKGFTLYLTDEENYYGSDEQYFQNMQVQQFHVGLLLPLLPAIPYFRSMLYNTAIQELHTATFFLTLKLEYNISTVVNDSVFVPVSAGGDTKNYADLTSLTKAAAIVAPCVGFTSRTLNNRQEKISFLFAFYWGSGWQQVRIDTREMPENKHLVPYAYGFYLVMGEDRGSYFYAFNCTAEWTGFFDKQTDFNYGSGNLHINARIGFRL